jgi:diaminohydroxyphosphoribosylaminopyrimidine deaminase/5-amino-6-(5-phosphoribosylamino)uracil reductase
MKFSDNDKTFMAKAVNIAFLAKGKTFPNPAVGAVIVTDGRIVGEGATQECGGPHAEIVALRNARNKAIGGALYVTLEPCCHYGRTPPCTDAIIESGIKKVFVAVKDPNPLVCGKGILQLENAGIEVVTDLLSEEAALVNEDFFWAITRKRAWVSVKLAQTLDGKIADEYGTSKWITGENSRLFVQELRRTHAAIAVGRTTLEKDDPQLNVRHREGFFPARIVFTSKPQIPQNSYFYRHALEARSIVVLSNGKKRIEKDANSGIEYWYTGEDRYSAGHLLSFLETAWEQGLTSIMVEGGGRLASQFIEARFVNKLYLFIGNKILGGGFQAISFNKGLALDKCISLDKMNIERFGDDILISGDPNFLEEQK